jgi:hypothetical protein
MNHIYISMFSIFDFLSGGHLTCIREKNLNLTAIQTNEKISFKNFYLV